jgi:hypothetical protein
MAPATEKKIIIIIIQRFAKRSSLDQIHESYSKNANKSLPLHASSSSLTTAQISSIFLTYLFVSSNMPLFTVSEDAM